MESLKMLTVDGKEYSDALFVHVPKTAGSSIALELNRMGMNKWVRTFHKSHDTLPMLLKNNIVPPDVFTFSVVRNPYTRTYSYYRHFIKLNKLKQSAMGFKDFITLLENRTPMPSNPLIHIDQSAYVFDPEDSFFLHEIYQFENLKRLEEDLGITLPHVNSGEYSQEEYLRAYSNDYVIHRVKERFRDDFENLGYSKDFDKTII